MRCPEAIYPEIESFLSERRRWSAGDWQVGREICLTVSREITISLFRIAPGGIGLRGRREYSTTRRNNTLRYNIISRELDLRLHEQVGTHIYARARARTHTIVIVFVAKQIDYYLQTVV